MHRCDDKVGTTTVDAHRCDGMKNVKTFCIATH